jgi:hypothetical protein
MTDDDPNEAYEVVPIEPGPHGPPKGWWTVKRNGLPVRHFPGKEKAQRYATDPAYRASLVTRKAWEKAKGKWANSLFTTWHRLAHDRAEATTMQGEPSEQVYRFRFHFGAVGKRSASYAACTWPSPSQHDY